MDPFQQAINAARIKVVFVRFVTEATALIRIEAVGGYRAAIRVNKSFDEYAVDLADFERAPMLSAALRSTLAEVYALFVRAVDAARSAFAAVSAYVQSAAASAVPVPDSNKSSPTAAARRALSFAVTLCEETRTATVWVTRNIAGLTRKSSIRFSGSVLAHFCGPMHAGRIAVDLGVSRDEAIQVFDAARALADLEIKRRFARPGVLLASLA